jgi:hypothetical protein
MRGGCGDEQETEHQSYWAKRLMPHCGASSLLSPAGARSGRKCLTGGGNFKLATQKIFTSETARRPQVGLCCLG